MVRCCVRIIVLVLPLLALGAGARLSAAPDPAPGFASQARVSARIVTGVTARAIPSQQTGTVTQRQTRPCLDAASRPIAGCVLIIRNME